MSTKCGPIPCVCLGEGRAACRLPTPACTYWHALICQTGLLSSSQSRPRLLMCRDFYMQRQYCLRRGRGQRAELSCMCLFSLRFGEPSPQGLSSVFFGFFLHIPSVTHTQNIPDGMEGDKLCQTFHFSQQHKLSPMKHKYDHLPFKSKLTLQLRAWYQGLSYSSEWPRVGVPHMMASALIFAEVFPTGPGPGKILHQGV